MRPGGAAASAAARNAEYKAGMKRSPCSAPLALRYAMLVAISLSPRVQAATAAKLPAKRQQRLELTCRPPPARQTFQHGLAGDMVKGPDRVGRWDGRARIEGGGGRCGGVCERFRCSSGDEAEQVLQASFLECGWQGVPRQQGASKRLWRAGPAHHQRAGAFSLASPSSAR